MSEIKCPMIGKYNIPNEEKIKIINQCYKETLDLCDCALMLSINEAININSKEK